MTTAVLTTPRTVGSTVRIARIVTVVAVTLALIALAFIVGRVTKHAAVATPHATTTVTQPFTTPLNLQPCRQGVRFC